MKVDDSGMPEEAYWNSLFDIDAIVEWLHISKAALVAEIGCGYGTFTVPVAKKTSGKVCAFDIEAAMLEVARENVRNAALSNVIFSQRDVLEQGTGLASGSVDMVLLFNILHSSERRVFLAEAARILKTGGVLAIIHWRKDVHTPRGPAVELRPDQQQILAAAEGLNLGFDGNDRVLKPYHWGIQLVKI
jgi:ubiquinone/menaquinone biosynthesis C-methylase UbiE